MNVFNMSFWDVHLGPDEAKGDKNLEKYFVPIKEYNGILCGDYRYIIGRKGSGKTAVLEKIRLEAENDPIKFVQTLSLKDFPLQILRGLRDKGLEDKSQYVPAWKFLILIELCKMIMKDNNVEQIKLREEIKEFINLNFPGTGAFADTLTYLHKNSAKVNILLKYLGGEFQKESTTQKTTSIYYQKAVEYLQDKVGKIISESTYFMLFDELDEGFKSNDKGKRLLILSLLRAIEDICILCDNTEIKFRPVLALRSDIFDGLEDNDLNKLDDYIIRLNWTSGNNNNGYSVKDIVNHRIKASLADRYGIDLINEYFKDVDLWNIIADDNSAPYGNKSLWKFMCNQTFEKPRDIIKYLKYCQKTSGSGKLNGEIVKSTEIKYSNWFYRELRDEIQSFLPVWKEALQCITKLGVGKANADDILDLFKNEPNIKQWLGANNKNKEEILRLLFDYSVVGNLDTNGRWLFKYKDEDLTFVNTKQIIVHFGFYKKLALKYNIGN